MGVDEALVNEDRQHLAMAAGVSVGAGAFAFGRGAEVATAGLSIIELGDAVLVAIVVAVVEDHGLTYQSTEDESDD